MGLDATVYCGCFEQGRLRTQPDPSWKLFLTEEGQIECRSDDLKTLMAFDAWRQFACEHEGGELLSHRIGNMTQVAFLRECLSNHADWFPIILDKVIYSGTHAGDWIGVEIARQLVPEIERIPLISASTPEDQMLLDQFRRQMAELAECALTANKPIVF